MKQIRVYGINLNLLKEGQIIGINNIIDNDWMDLSEELGFVWSLNGFKNQFNNLELDFDNIIIRFI